MKYLAMLFTLAAIVFAGTTGRVSGILTDSNGMPVAGGKLTITNKQMGLETSATSNKKGEYGFPTLQPGTYNLHAEAPGFAPQDHATIVVHVNSAIKVDFTLGTN